MRAFTRHNDNLIRYRATHIQRMQKALYLMSLQLANVISDIAGKMGMKLLRAVVAGQQDPKILARYRDLKCRNSVKTIAKFPQGNDAHEYLFQLKQALELYDYYTEKIKECDREIERRYRAMRPKVNPAEDPLRALPKRTPIRRINGILTCAQACTAAVGST